MKIFNLTIFALIVTTVASLAENPAPSEKTNLLGWAQGAFVVRTPSPARTKANVVALDGLNTTTGIGVPRHAPLPHEIIIELPAETNFTSFAVPELGEFGPAKGKHVKTVEIHGSNESPDTGFTPLAKLVIEIEKKAPQEFAVPEPRPVRWLKIRFLDRYKPQEKDHDEVLFSELLGYGTQEPRKAPEKGFNGIWTLRRGHELSTNLMELQQKGNQIQGCQILGGQTGTISGTVEGGLARIVATTTQGGKNVSTPMIARITAEGEIHGVSSFHAGLSHFSGVPSPEGTKTNCSETPDPENPVSTALKAGLSAVIYGIHFDVDSDTLRSDATPAIEQILEALKENTNIAVIIEGHTDSDGEDDHNLDLSQRRAAAVIHWLTEREIPATRLKASGLGETKPIAKNESAVGRAMNRRVEVKPQ